MTLHLPLYTSYPLANIVVGFVDPYPEAGNLVNFDGLNKCLPLTALCRPEIKQSHKNLTLAGLPTIPCQVLFLVYAIQNPILVGFEKEHGRTGWWFAVAGGPCRVTSGNFLIEGLARWGRLTWP